MEDGSNEHESYSSEEPAPIKFSWSKPAPFRPTRSSDQENPNNSPLIKFGSSSTPGSYRSSRLSLPSTFAPPNIENELNTPPHSDSDMCDSSGAPSPSSINKQFTPARIDSQFRPARVLNDSSNLTPKKSNTPSSRRASGPPTPSSRLTERLLQRKQQSASNRTNESRLWESSVPSPLQHSSKPQSPAPAPPTADVSPTLNQSPNPSASSFQPDRLLSSSNRPPDGPAPRSQGESARHSASGSTRGRSLSRAPTEGTGQEKSVMAVQALADIVQENSSLKSEIERLKARVSDLDFEVSSLSTKNRVMQGKAADSLRDAGQRLESLKTELGSLREQAAPTAALALELKEAKEEIVTLRTSLDVSLTELKPLVEDSSDVLGRATLTRHMIEDIRQEAQSIAGDADRKQKVIDLLRERSDMYAGDLSEARDRICTLEMEQVKSRQSLDKASEEITLAGARIAELSTELQHRQQEYLNAVVETEKLKSTHEGMQTKIREQETKLTELEASNKDLQTQFTTSAEAEKHLRKDVDCIPSLQARIECLSSLEAEVKGKEDLITALRSQLDSLREVDSEVKRKDKQIQKLQEDIQTHRVAESSLKATIDNLQEVKQQVARLQVDAAKAGILEVDLAALKEDMEREKTGRIRAIREAELSEKRLRDKEQELISMEGKLQRSNARCESFEERRIVQETANRNQVDDITTRLHACDAKLVNTIRDLQASNSKIATLVAIDERREIELSKLKSSLEVAVKERDGQILQLRVECERQAGFSREYQAKYQETQALAKQAQDRSDRLQSSLEELQVRLDQANAAADERILDLTESIEAKDAEITNLTWAAEAARRDAEGVKAELSELSQKVLTLEARPVYGEEEVQSFLERFRSGATLTPLEAAIAEEAVKLASDLTQRELGMKANEIKGKDTELKACRARVQELEEKMEKMSKEQQPAVIEVATKARASSPLSDARAETPTPDDEVTNDLTPPSPALPPTRPIQYSSQTGRQATYARSGVPLRRNWATLNKDTTSEDQSISSEETPIAKPSTRSNQFKPSAPSKKRTHDALDYDDIEDDDEEEVAAKPVSKAKQNKPARRGSAGGPKPVVQPVPPKTRGKKRR